MDKIGVFHAQLSVDRSQAETRRCPSRCLMSLETYQARFPGDPRRSHAIEEMPQEHLDLLEDALMDEPERNTHE